MTMRARRDVEIFNMSFLDVISCGFGAVIILLVISLAFEPKTVELISKDLKNDISEKIKLREEITKNSQALSRDLATKKKNLEQLVARVVSLKGNWSHARRNLSAAMASADQQKKKEETLKTTQQKLTLEMKRLLNQAPPKLPSKNSTIGGIPVDSEYIIFVIDTSGSMKQAAWHLVVKKIREILKVYPRVRGIQVMNDMGTYMFPTYRGQWIPDTPGRRKAVIDRLRSWVIFSNSSPVEGIYAAVKTFYRPGRPTSVFVFGDDFNGPNINSVLKTISLINKKNAAGQSQVRIHTFGFPVYAVSKNKSKNLMRFAHLMRLLAENNSGSFVGLNSLN
jgi:hypothetical protein